MPAVSRSQQRFFGMIRAAQKGKKGLPASVQRAAKSISPEAAHDFAVTKHKNLPEKIAMADNSSPGKSAAVRFAEKLAYVQPAPATHSTSAVLPSKPRDNFQHPPQVGQSKLPTPVPPATADAKMVMRAAPSVPNPIVPPSQSGDPMPTQKVAAATLKIAPRYSAGAKKGKKVMPQPHARQTKMAFAEQLAGNLPGPPPSPLMDGMPEDENMNDPLTAQLQQRHHLLQMMGLNQHAQAATPAGPEPLANQQMAAM